MLLRSAATGGRPLDSWARMLGSYAGGETRTRTPPKGTPDFKSPLPISVYLGRSEFFLLTGPIVPSHRRRSLGLSRRVSLPPSLPPLNPSATCDRRPG